MRNRLADKASQITSCLEQAFPACRGAGANGAAWTRNVQLCSGSVAINDLQTSA